MLHRSTARIAGIGIALALVASACGPAAGPGAAPTGTTAPVAVATGTARPPKDKLQLPTIVSTELNLASLVAYARDHFGEENIEITDFVLGSSATFRAALIAKQFDFGLFAFVHNPIARIAHETAATFFPADPPTFYEVPFSLHDPESLQALLAQAGFGEIAWTRLEKSGTSPSSADAATGLIEGNPILGSIMERRPEALGDIKQAVAAAIAAELGDHPVTFPLRALVFSARRP